MKICPQFWMCFRLFKFFLWTTYNFGQIFACIFMLFFMSSLISYLRRFSSGRLGRDRTYGSWIRTTYMHCNQYLSPLTLWIEIMLKVVLNTILILITQMFASGKVYSIWSQCPKWTVTQSPNAANILFGRPKAAPN